MKKAFDRFENARKIIHENIINYIADYRQFNGTSQDRKEFLEGEYQTRTPNLNNGRRILATLVVSKTALYFTPNK